jgi:hypothetical protein
MKSIKRTPLEVLQKQKVHLQNKSDVLTGALEDRFGYLQQNIASLLSESVVSAAISRMPPFVQNLAKKGDRNEAEESGSSGIPVYLASLAEGMLEFLPFFLKGKKGLIAGFLLKYVKKIFFKK